MSIWAVILAAGTGSRLSRAGLPDSKQFIVHRGRPLYWQSVLTMSRVPRVSGLILVFPPDRLEQCRDYAASLFETDDPGLPWFSAPGGSRRQDSVASGLALVPAGCDKVLVHDAARPFMTAGLVNDLIDALESGSPAAVPALPVTDTIKIVEDGVAVSTPDRSALCAVQTPQAFDLKMLAAAHEAADEKGWNVTDDASMIEMSGHTVALVPGEPGNVKITTPEDLKMLNKTAAPLPRVGWGYDVHRFGPGRAMRLGGVPIAGGPEVVAHSDGDVLLHAVTDAVLGLMAAGDIGQHFPDSDPEWEGIESSVMLAQVLAEAGKTGLEIIHADLTVIAQIPKLAPWRNQIRDNMARLLGLDRSRVNVKATTEEGLGFTGQKKGIKAVACLTALAAPESET